MKAACGHRYDIGQAGRQIALPVQVTAPGGHSAIRSKRQTMALTTGHRHYPGQAIRYPGLTFAIVAPGDDGAVAADREAVVFPRRDNDHIRQTGGNDGLANEVRMGTY